MPPARETAASPAAFVLREGCYEVRLARDGGEVLRAQRLRYAVFHDELGEGVADSDGVDVDRFDAQCDHLLLIDRAHDAVVGTYRLQTVERARSALGFYCAVEFALDALPEDVVAQAVELGRACIERAHRNGTALLALWRGIAAYLTHHGKHLLFGCCSLTGTDPALGLRAAAWLAREDRMHPSLLVRTAAPHVCVGAWPGAEEIDAFRPPKLFATYLRYGALVCSGPAIDHAFGTIDFLVLLDTTRFDPRVRALFFGS